MAGDQSAVPAGDAAARIDEVAPLRRDAAELAQEARRSQIRDKPECPCESGLRVFKAEVCGEGADLSGFAVFADRKQLRCASWLCHLVKHIALIAYAAQEQE